MEQAGQNRMGTVPVPRLMLSMALPIMFSMIVQALYNVVDSLFVSHIADTALIVDAGDKAVGALALAFPVQMVIIALTVGTGVGINSALARSLGQNDRMTASRIAGNAVFLFACYAAAMTVFGFVGVRPYLLSQTSDPVVADYGITYLRIIALFSFANIGYMCFEKLLQATGKSTAAMFGQLTGSVVNLVLDPILIFGWFGLPAMGVRGAAIATVIGYSASFGVAFVLHLTQNRELTNALAMLKPNAAIIRRIYAVGGPAIVMQSLVSVMLYGMNLILGSITASAVTAYGVYYKLQNFIWMPAFGLNNASIPVISYNYGAGHGGRIRQAIRTALTVVLIIMGTGLIVLQVFAGQIVGWFGLSGHSAALCRTAVHLVTLGLLFAGVNIILQGVCQALGNGMYSLLVSLLRMLVVVLPLAWILSRTANAETLVWLAFPCAELCGCVVSAVLAASLYRKRMAAISPREGIG